MYAGDGCVEQKLASCFVSFGLINVGWKSDGLQHPLLGYTILASHGMCAIGSSQPQ